MAASSARRCAVEPPALGLSYACPPPLVDTSTTPEYSTSTPWGRPNGCAATSQPPLVAHCVAGLARTFVLPWVYRSLRRNLVNGFGGRAATLLLIKTFKADGDKTAWKECRSQPKLETWWSSIRRAQLQGAIDYVAPQLVRLLQDDAIAEAAVNHGCNISWHGAPVGGVAPSPLEGPYRLFYSTEAGRTRLAGQLAASGECLHMIEEYERAHDIRFEYVTRSRPDLAFLSPMLPYCFFAHPKVMFIDKKDYLIAMRRETAAAFLTAPLEHYRRCRGTAWWVEHEQLLRASAFLAGYSYKVFALPACRSWTEHRPEAMPRRMPGGEFSCHNEARLGLHLQSSADLHIDRRTGAFVCQGNCTQGAARTGYSVANCSRALRTACITGSWDNFTDERCLIPGFPKHPPCPTGPACERDIWHLPSKIPAEALIFNAPPPHPHSEPNLGGWRGRYNYWLTHGLGLKAEP